MKLHMISLAWILILTSCMSPIENSKTGATARTLSTPSVIDVTLRYKIKNAVNNTSLDVTGYGAPLSSAVIWQTYSSPTQNWKIEPSDEAGYYYIRNCNGTFETRLDVTGYGAVGSQVVGNSPYYSDTQKWMFVATGGGYYKIYNKSKNTILDCLGGGAATSGVVVYYDYPTPTQSWKLEGLPTSDEIYTVDLTKRYKISNPVQNTCLDVTANGASLGSAVIWQNYSSPTQVWQFVASDEPGYYYINNCNGTYQTRLDVAAYGADGAGAVTYAPYYSDTQKWRIVSTGDGFFKIYNKSKDMCLDCLGGGAATSGVVVYHGYPTPTQTWKLEVYLGI